MARRGGGRAARSDPGSGGGSQKSSASRTRCRGTFGLRRRREVPGVALHGSWWMWTSVPRRKADNITTACRRAAPPPRGVFYDPNQGGQYVDPSQAYMVPQYARHYPGHYYAAPIPLAPIPSDAGSSGPPSPPSPRRTRRPRRRGSPRDSPVADDDEAETAAPKRKRVDGERAAASAARPDALPLLQRRGAVKRGAGCWFLHSDEAAEPSLRLEDESKSPFQSSASSSTRFCELGSQGRLRHPVADLVARCVENRDHSVIAP